MARGRPFNDRSRGYSDESVLLNRFKRAVAQEEGPMAPTSAWKNAVISLLSQLEGLISEDMQRRNIAREFDASVNAPEDEEPAVIRDSRPPPHEEEEVEPVVTPIPPTEPPSFATLAREAPKAPMETFSLLEKLRKRIAAGAK